MVEAVSAPTWRELAVRLVHVARIMYQRSSWRRWQRRRVSRRRSIERADRDIRHLEAHFLIAQYHAARGAPIPIRSAYAGPNLPMINVPIALEHDQTRFHPGNPYHAANEQLQLAAFEHAVREREAKAKLDDVRRRVDWMKTLAVVAIMSGGPIVAAMWVLG